MGKSILELREIYSKGLESFSWPTSHPNLYDPAKYLLGIGGKRIRPSLALAGYNLYKNNFEEVLPAANAVEFFHNFSLMHDDIMDVAELRRGHPTVHKKYDLNTAILSGDVMLIYAYKFFEQYPAELNVKLTKIFNTTSIQICEGQQMDIDFESRSDVSIDEYIQMISFKTAVLLGASLQFGALIGGASDADAAHLYGFGKNIGIAFQVQDDILDVWASSEDSGKVVGGDILQKKKTYLYLKSLDLLPDEQSARLESLYSVQSEVAGEDLVEEVRSLYGNAHVNVYAQELKMNYQQLAFSHLDAVQVDAEKKIVLKEYANALLDRSK